MNLTNPTEVAQLLQSHGLYTRKQFGQHFLINAQVLQRIVQTANIQPTDTVLEIGPGIGVLTRELAQRAARVISFEIDTTLQPVLQQTVGEYSNVELYYQDFLKADLGEVIQAANLTTNDKNLAASQPCSLAIPYKLVANLPYNAGSHILDVLLKNPNPPQSITVLLQKEVAQKIVATPPHATYLSNFFQSYGQAELVEVVPPHNFFPPPKVDSAILHINRVADIGLQVLQDQHQNPIPATPDPAKLSRFLHRGFANPRKMLNKVFSKEELAQAHIDATSRAENLTLAQWLELYKVSQSDSN